MYADVDQAFFTVLDLAQLLRLSRKTIFNYVNDGRIPPPQKITARTTRWPRAAVLDVLRLGPRPAGYYSAAGVDRPPPAAELPPHRDEEQILWRCPHCGAARSTANAYDPLSQLCNDCGQQGCTNCTKPDREAGPSLCSNCSQAAARSAPPPPAKKKRGRPKKAVPPAKQQELAEADTYRKGKKPATKKPGRPKKS